MRPLQPLLECLRLYARAIPFARGRGLFARPLWFGLEHGLSAPIVDLACDSLRMEFERSLLGWKILSDGWWEESQSRLVLRLLRPGDTVIDVGANSGYFAVLCGARVGSGGTVIAFEMQSNMARALRRNCALNNLPNVEVIEQGCWSRQQEASVCHVGDPLGAYVSIDALDERAEHVTLRTVDELLSERRLKGVRLLLIDTEGADFEVVQGAEQVISQHRPFVMMETTHLHRFGSTLDDAQTWFANRRYTHVPGRARLSEDLLFVPAEYLNEIRPWLGDI